MRHYPWNEDYDATLELNAESLSFEVSFTWCFVSPGSAVCCK